MSEAFINSWRVTEYVFDAHGQPIGRIAQERDLHKLENGHIRVTQRCKPQLSDPGSPMHGFAGEWVFELERAGRVRRYLGPDVLGTGLGWGDDAITGRGVWTRFGFGFVSFGVMLSPTRQLTGGSFMTGGGRIASIIGVGSTGDGQAPALDQTQMPYLIGQYWEGTTTRFDAAGITTAQHGLTRMASDGGWVENDSEITFNREAAHLIFQKRGPSPMHGAGRRLGCALEYTLVDKTTHLESLSILDAASSSWIELTHEHVDGNFSALHCTILNCINTAGNG